MFLRELAASGDSAGRAPRKIVAAVAHEVEALTPAPRALVEGAAVAGDPFDPELAAAAAAVPPDSAAIDALVAADLVRPAGEGPRFAFRHPLVHRALYDALPPAWRLEAHARVASELERRGARAALRAFHVEKFARPGDASAIALLSEAGAAAAGSAPATAAHWYAAGLRLVDDGDAERRAELLAGIAAALAAAGRLAEARDALASCSICSVRRRHRCPRLSVRCAAAEGLLGRHAEARERLLVALREAPAEGRGPVLLGLATAALYTGDVRGMRSWARRAEKAAGDDALLRADAEGCGALGALWEGDAMLGGQLLDRATERFGGVDDGALAARLECARQLAGAQLLAERYADAADTAARGLATARRTNQLQSLPALLHARAGALGNLLELAPARQEIDAAVDAARLQRLPHPVAFMLWQRAIILRFQGAAPEAARDAAEFAELAARLESNRLIRTGLCSTASVAADDDPERCLHRIVSVAGPTLDEMLPSWWTARS